MHVTNDEQRSGIIGETGPRPIAMEITVVGKVFGEVEDGGWDGSEQGMAE